MNRKQLVREAVTCLIIGKATAIDVYAQRKIAIEALVKRGWRLIGRGSYKEAYRKGTVVAKVGNVEPDRRGYRNLNRSDMAHIAPKVYYFCSIGMVQRAVTCKHEKIPGWAVQKMHAYIDQLYDRGYHLNDVHIYNIGMLAGAPRALDFFCSPAYGSRCNCADCRQDQTTMYRRTKGRPKRRASLGTNH